MASPEGIGAAPESDLLLEARSHRAAEREGAFSEIFRRHRERVLALCVNLLGNRADAEDALQETFLAVHRGLPGFRGEAALGTWIHRIAIRVALRLKSRRARRAHPPIVAEPATVEPDALLAQELGERMGVALDSLSAEHRVVISLFATRGLSHAEIAEILGVPEGTVWSRLHNARRKLASSLEDYLRTSDASTDGSRSRRA